MTKPPTLYAVLTHQAPFPTIEAEPPPRPEPPNTDAANELRWRLAVWGGSRIDPTTGAWPTLHAAGLGATGAAWAAWLASATVADIERALGAAAAIDARGIDATTGEIVEEV